MSVQPSRGNYLEDFRQGQVLRHPTPRTVTEGDVALYTAIYGDRHLLASANTAAQRLGLPRAPVHDLVTFHVIFGKTVGQISLNAVANLGYAGGRFLAPVFPGDTLSAASEVLGTRELSNGKAGIVWVRTTGTNQDGVTVLEYARWVMVEKRDPATPTGAADKVVLPDAVPASTLRAPAWLDLTHWAEVAPWAGPGVPFEALTPGLRLDHVDGMTVEESDHLLATRLWQNTAKVHFNQHVMAGSRFGRRLVYGGHVISTAYALAHNGLAHTLGILALNGGTHASPTFAGDTLYAWSEVVETVALPDTAKGHPVGAARVRLYAAKNVDPSREPFPTRVTPDGAKGPELDPRIVLELDLWLLMARAS